MKKIRSTHNAHRKEKETILSLFRLPLTYFSEDSSTQKNEKKSHSSEIKVKVEKINTNQEETFTAIIPPDEPQPFEGKIKLELPLSQQTELSSTHSLEEDMSSNSSTEIPITPQSTSQDSTLASTLPNISESKSNESNSYKNDLNTIPTPSDSKTENASSNTPSTDTDTLHTPPFTDFSTSYQMQQTPTSTDSQNVSPEHYEKKSPPIQSQPESLESAPISQTKPTTSTSSENVGKNSTEKDSNKETNKRLNNDSNIGTNKSSSHNSNNEANKKTEQHSPSETSENPTKTTPQKNSSQEPQNSTQETLNKARDMHKKSPTDKTPQPEQKSESPLDMARDMKKKAADNIKNQAKKVIPQKLQNQVGSLKDTALNKAAPALNVAKNVNNLINGSGDDKAEAIGDTALKGASAALKASGMGAPVAAAVDVADKILESTEIGKQAKKTCGYCLSFSCCSSVLLILLPVFLFIGVFTSIWGWIFGIDANSDNIDRSNLENAITEDLLFETTRYGSSSIYDILEGRLRDEEFGFKKTVYNDDGSIKYDENGFQVLESINGFFDGTFSDIYTKHHLTPMGQFSTAYEILISNYTVDRIKEPRHDTGMSAYHMPLFENILEPDLTTLKNQFNFDSDTLSGQVPFDFWNDITRALRKEFDVYNPITGAMLSDITLHDLLIETSSTDGDATYDTRTVNAILNYTEDEGNLELASCFRRLQEALTRIEVMTYMMAIRDFYAQKEEFLTKLEYDRTYNRQAENYDFFAANDGAFFVQFLIIPVVETYMALSSTSSTPSFAYEIATNSMGVLNQTNAPRHLIGDKVYYFFETVRTWAATYTFYNNIDPKTGEYSLACNNIVSTELEDTLYKRYNITDPDSFFNLFEASTGIKISSPDSSTFFLVGDMLPQSSESSFPLAARTSITHGYKQRYSKETVTRYNLSHDEHYGVDFSAHEGTNVLAIKSGTVTAIIRSEVGFGNYMIISHPDGYSSIYAHGNGVFLVNQGASVSAGTPIMQSGNSGNSTGPHLHLQVYKTGSSAGSSHINPIEYINGLITQ